MAVQSYLRVFEQVFEKTGHIAHYRMMMRISETDEREPAEDEAIAAIDRESLLPPDLTGSGPEV